MWRHSSVWIYRSLPVLAVGLIGLMLLPGGQPSDGHAGQATASASAPRIDSIGPVADAPAPQLLPAAVRSAIQVHPGSIVRVAATLPTAPASTASTSALPNWANVENWAKAVTVAYTAPAASALPDGHIGAMAVNARAAPSSTGEKLFTLAAGEAVKLGTTSGGWVEVHRADGTTGWVYGRFLAGAANATPAAQPAVTEAAALSRPVPPRLPRGQLAHVVATVPVLSAPGEHAKLLFVLQPASRSTSPNAAAAGCTSSPTMASRGGFRPNLSAHPSIAPSFPRRRESSLAASAAPGPEN